MTSSTMSIGEVLSALRKEFPDISVSKIRFLESEGLLEPERTPAGYRKFSGNDIDRLRAILRLQRDSFLPLKVIRKRLADADARGEPPSAILVEPTTAAASNGSVGSDAAPEIVEFDQPMPARTWTDADLIHELGLSKQLIDQLVTEGVLCRHPHDGGQVFDADDAVMAEAAKLLLSLGWDLRNLRTLKRTAQQEAELLTLLSQAALRNPNPDARGRGVERLVSMRDAAATVRSGFIRARLRELLARTQR
jgi:DNA-binding transcriptional MerR regulator